MIAYHVLDDTFAFQSGQTFSRIVYFGSSFCVPMFFTVSGYTYGRQTFSLEYAERKVTNILKKLFGWVILWCVFYALVYGEEHNPFLEFIDGGFSSGILPVSWFIFTLSFCWLIGYFLLKLHEISGKLFDGLVLLAMIFMMIKRTTGEFGNLIGYDRGSQALWIGLYLTFFSIGIMLRDFSCLLVRESIPYKIFMSALLILVSHIYVSSSSSSGRAPDSFYGSWLYMIWFLLIFITCMNVSRYNDKLHIIAKGTFTVYMWHLPVLLYFTRYFPVMNGKIGVTYIIGLFMSGEIVFCGFQRVPLLRKMV